MTQNSGGISEILLRYRVENQEALDANRDLMDSIADMQVVAAEVDDDTEATTALIGSQAQAYTALTQQIIGFDEQTVQLTDHNLTLADSYSQISQQAQDAAQAAQQAAGAQSPIGFDPLSGGGGGGGDDGDGSGSSFGSGRSAARGLRYVASASGNQAVQDIASVAAATAFLGPAGLLAGTFAVALKAVSDGEQRATENADKFAGSLDKIQEQIAGGATSQDIQKQIDQLKVQKQIQSETVDSLGKLNDLYTQNVKNFAGGKISDSGYDNTNQGLASAISTLTGGQITTAAGISAAYTAEQQKVTETATQIGLLNAQLGTTQVIVNDIISGSGIFGAGGKKIAAQFTDGLSDGIEQAFTANNVFAHLGDHIRDGIEQVVELSVNPSVLAQLFADTLGQGLSTGIKQALQDASNAAQLQVVQDSISYGTQLNQQRRTATPTDIANNLGSLEDEEQSLIAYIPELQRLAQTSQAARDQLTQAQDRLGQISDDFADQIGLIAGAEARAQNQLNQDVQQIRDQADEQQQQDYAQLQSRLSDIAQQGADQQQQIAQDNSDRIAQINQQATQSEQNAVANRDAGAFDQAKQTQQNQLSQQAQQYARQESQLTTTLSRETTAAQQSYQTQISNLVHSEEQQIEAKDNSYYQQIEQLNSYISAQQTITASGFGGLEQVAINAFINMEPAYYNAGQSAASQILNGFYAALGTGGGGISSVGAPVGAASLLSANQVSQVATSAARNYVHGLYQQAGLVPNR